MKGAPVQLLSWGLINHALGLCCSQWHEEHFTGRGKNGLIKYRKILGPNITLSVKKLKRKRGRILQQGKDPKHLKIHNGPMDDLKRCKLKVLPWPSQLPDLNIIENL